MLDEQARNPAAPASLATVRTVLQRFGFLYPQEIVDLPASVRFAPGDKPLGMTHADDRASWRGPGRSGQPRLRFVPCWGGL